MLVGNYIVSNMVYNQMDRCQLTVPLDREMIHFKLSLLKQEQENVRLIRMKNRNLSFRLDVPRTVFIDLEPTVIGRNACSHREIS